MRKGLLKLFILMFCSPREEYVDRKSNKMDRFFYIAGRKCGLPISALSQLVRECRSDDIHVRHVYMTYCDFTCDDISLDNKRM